MPLPRRPSSVEYRKHLSKCRGNEVGQLTQWSTRNLCLPHMSELKKKKYNRSYIIGGGAVEQKQDFDEVAAPRGLVPKM